MRQTDNNKQMISPINQKYMIAAIEHVATHIEDNEGGPFGACIVKNDEIICLAHNTVLKENDATCHAEINAIRIASKKLKTHNLSGCTIYSTTEPCPMCFSAIHWARIDKIVSGSEIDDVKKLGFNELSISNQTLKQLGQSKIELITGYQREACIELLNDWKKRSLGKMY